MSRKFGALREQGTSRARVKANNTKLDDDRNYGLARVLWHQPPVTLQTSHSRFYQPGGADTADEIAARASQWRESSQADPPRDPCDPDDALLANRPVPQASRADYKTLPNKKAVQKWENRGRGRAARAARSDAVADR